VRCIWLRSAEPKASDRGHSKRVVAPHYMCAAPTFVSAPHRQRRFRPRQVGDVVSGQTILTLRSLPEIGRRFGDAITPRSCTPVRRSRGLVAKDVALLEEVESSSDSLQSEVIADTPVPSSWRGGAGGQRLGPFTLAFQAGKTWGTGEASLATGESAPLGSPQRALIRNQL